MSNNLKVLFFTNLYVTSDKLEENEYNVFKFIFENSHFSEEYFNKNRIVANISHMRLDEILNKFKIAKEKVSELWSKFIGTIIKFNHLGREIITSLITNVRSCEDYIEFILCNELYILIKMCEKVGVDILHLYMTKDISRISTKKLCEIFLVLKKENKNDFTICIDDLKKYLRVDNNKSYVLYANFKNRILIPVLAELNNKLNVNFEFTENKLGAKVESLTFSII